MRYQLLGRTGLRVSELCLGAMVFGDSRGKWGASREEAFSVMSLFADHGGNFVDTASNYAGGESERLVGEFVACNRDEWVLASKYTVTSRPKDPNAGGNHRKSLVQALDATLKRLDTDYVDLYWVHAHDPFTPVEEIVRALDDQVRAGKILYVGMSDTPAWRVAKAIARAECQGLTRFEAIQIPYSLTERSAEREYVPLARAEELTITCWAPLGGGLLTGRYGSDRVRPADTRLALIGGRHEENTTTARAIAIADVVNAIATAHDVPAPAVAISWIIAQRKLARIVPIVGIKNAQQLRDNLQGLEVKLETEELARLEMASKPDLGFPHDFDVRSLVYGTTLQSIDAPYWRN